MSERWCKIEEIYKRSGPYICRLYLYLAVYNKFTTAYIKIAKFLLLESIAGQDMLRLYRTVSFIPLFTFYSVRFIVQRIGRIIHNLMII